MFKPIEFWIGWRYTRAKRRNHFISFISIVSMLGIFLGVSALIIVISVMNGFESELRHRMLSMISHVTIHSRGNALQDWQQVADIASENPHVLAAAPYIEQQTLIRGKRVKGALVRAIDPMLEGQVDDLPDQLIAGEITDLISGQFGVILGAELAWQLGVSTGDKITLFAPELKSTPAGLMPQVKRFTVVGLFQAGMNEYDGHLAVIHLQDGQRLFRLPDAVNGVRLKLDDMDRAYPVSRELAEALPTVYRVRDWMSQHANWFRAVQTEKITMFIILFLIVAVAAFNIISTLVMAVTDKQSEIAILRTQGMSPGSIMAVFMVQGVLIGTVGTLMGVAFGSWLAVNVEHIVPAIERLLQTDLLPDDLYYITDLKGEVRWNEVFRIGVFSFLATLLSTIYPAWRAARTHPAEALRYE